MNESELCEVERACREGNVDALEAGLALIRTPCLDTPLIVAARHGHLGCVQNLIQRGANVDALVRNANLLSGHSCVTALVVASAHGNVQIVDCLLQKGANPNGRLDETSTPLAAACQQGHVDVVHRLLRVPSLHLPVDVFFKNLPTDAVARHHLVTRLLEDSRISHDHLRRKCDGQTILHKACQTHNVSLVDLVATHDKTRHLLNTRDNQGKTPLYLVAGSLLDDAIVQCLMKHGADPIGSLDGTTPLHRAITSARLGQVQALLASATVNVNAVTKTARRTPFMCACHEYWKPNGGGDMRDIVVALLKDDRLDVNAADTEGRNVLHHASSLGLVWLVELLLANDNNKHTVNIHAHDKHGQTALHMACANNHLAIVRHLVHRGACLVTPRDKHGRNPLGHVLLHGGHCLQLLYYVMREHQGWMHLEAW